MLAALDDLLPAIVEQPSVLEDLTLVLLAEIPPEGARAKVRERTEPLVVVRGDLPATALANAVREIGLVPFDRAERLVQRSDRLDARAPHDPRPDHDVDLRQSKPVQRALADRKHHVIGEVEIVPGLERPLEGKTYQQAADQAQQADVRVATSKVFRSSGTSQSTSRNMSSSQTRKSGARASRKPRLLHRSWFTSSSCTQRRNR